MAEATETVTKSPKFASLSDELLVKRRQPKQQTEASRTERPKLELVRDHINKMLRVKISDGRVLIGLFFCTDRDMNLILANTAEFGCGEETEPRPLGLVMIPGTHIVSIETTGETIVLPDSTV